MDYLLDFFSNKMLWTSIFACFMAQFLKVFSGEKKFDLTRIITSGGMPSSHSSFVTCLSTMLGVKYGFNSDMFAIAAVFSFIIMYDASGVRQAVGKQATIINLIMIAVGAVLYLDLNVAKNMPGSAGQIFHVIFMAFVIIYYVLFLYVYPVLARFYNTIRNTIKNALFMAIRHLPYTVVMVLIGLCPLLLLFIGSYQIQSTLFALFLVMGFGVIAYCNSFFLVKIFDHYMPKEENEEQKSEGTEV